MMVNYHARFGKGFLGNENLRDYLTYVSRAQSTISRLLLPYFFLGAALSLLGSTAYYYRYSCLAGYQPNLLVKVKTQCMLENLNIY